MINKPLLMVVGTISVAILSACEPLDYRQSPVSHQENTTSTLAVDLNDSDRRHGTPPHTRDRGDYHPIDFQEDDFGKGQGKVDQHSRKPGKWPGQHHEDLPDDEDFPGEYGPESLPGIDRNPDDLRAARHFTPRGCRSTDPRNFCLNLKYVIYQDRSQHADALLGQLEKTLGEINQIWDTCGIEFQLAQLKLINPVRHGLNRVTHDSAEFSRIRQKFQDDRHFLVVATSNWSRHGSLGNSRANAWTNLPGDQLHGVIVERRAAYDPNVIAHELGHYLSLDHHSDRRDLMSPVIYSSSTTLTPSQCRTARAAVRTFWTDVMR
jgi:hypothetical protein